MRVFFVSALLLSVFVSFASAEETVKKSPMKKATPSAKTVGKETVKDLEKEIPKTGAPAEKVTPPEKPAPMTTQEQPTVLEEAKETLEESGKKLGAIVEDSRYRRGRTEWYILGTYSPLDLIIPSKFGGTVGYNSSASRSWEFEYVRGSAAVPFLTEDIGSMTDQRMSLITRSFAARNSFNVFYGISYFDFNTHLGSAIISRLSGGSVPNIDLLHIQSLGLNFGIGNRWTVNRNITLGVDWFSWYQPIVVTKKDDVFLDYVTNANDRDDVDTAVKYATYLPRLVFLKLQVGIAF